jgi:nucleotide-binding universal stress UspA family protein
MKDAAAPPTVVVGVKDTARSRDAIRLAAREASYRGAGLLAITAYSADHSLGAPAGRPLAVTRSAEDERLTAESVLRDAVADALGDQAERVAVQALPGPGGRVLVEAARKLDADLIVVATRGGAMTAGTVSQYLLRRAPCPVLVVPAAGGGGTSM